MASVSGLGLDGLRCFRLRVWDSGGQDDTCVERLSKGSQNIITLRNVNNWNRALGSLIV